MGGLFQLLSAWHQLQNSTNPTNPQFILKIEKPGTNEVPGFSFKQLTKASWQKLAMDYLILQLAC
jgi:hypothetical protein